MCALFKILYAIGEQSIQIQDPLNQMHLANIPPNPFKWDALLPVLMKPEECDALQLRTHSKQMSASIGRGALDPKLHLAVSLISVHQLHVVGPVVSLFSVT
eukprot:208387_1